MIVIQFIEGVPIWVWLLFIFLIKRGIVALSDREVTIRRLFFTPILFFIWGIYDVINEISYPNYGLIMMFLGILVGIVIGIMLWFQQLPLKNSVNEGYIIRSGTPLTLIMIIIAFLVKFIIISISYTHTLLNQTLLFSIFFGFISGLVDGIFWGGTLRLFVPWYKKKNN